MENNGEISMSIEETNRMRAALGLKPLSLEKKADKVVDLAQTAEQREAEETRKQLEAALARSKKKRELAKSLAGKSLGEELKESAQSSALDWVKQSRHSMADLAKKTSAKQKKKEAAYDSSALGGMTVGHDVNTFDEGQEVVLTLKDTRILAEDGNDINEGEDELINVELHERDMRDAHKKQAQRALMPTYSGYDDDEFIQMGNPVKRKRNAAPRLLAQYDEDEDRKDAENARKFTLDASGRKHVENIVEEEPGLDDVEVVSLAMPAPKHAADYFTNKEVQAQFATKKGKKLRKKKKLRQRNEEEAEQESNAQAEDGLSLVAQLEAEAKQSEGGSSRDRGKRKRPVHDDDDEAMNDLENENLLRFQEAREKASAVASTALENTRAKKIRRVVEHEDALDADAMDMELSAALSRTRQLAQLRAVQLAPVPQAVEVSPLTAPVSSSVVSMPPPPPLAPTVLLTSEEKIAALVQQTMERPSAPVASVTASDVLSSTSGSVDSASASSNVVVFNDATDFETRLRMAMEQRTAQFQAALGGGVAPPVAAAPSVDNASTPAMAVEETKTEDNDSEEEESKDDGEAWGDDQPLLGAGLGATLALLQKTGDLRETRTERQAGRANDARDRTLHEDLRIKDGVKLDYRDEFGRLLTKKEAFRLLSYKFHGHAPGKKKKEKRLKQLKEELLAQKMVSGEGSTKMMKVLEKKQKHAKQAHVVLSGGT